MKTASNCRSSRTVRMSPRMCSHSGLGARLTSSIWDEESTSVMENLCFRWEALLPPPLPSSSSVCTGARLYACSTQPGAPHFRSVEAARDRDSSAVPSTAATGAASGGHPSKAATVNPPSGRTLTLCRSSNVPLATPPSREADAFTPVGCQSQLVATEGAAPRLEFPSG
jgi:hypothetical protein